MHAYSASFLTLRSSALAATRMTGIQIHFPANRIDGIQTSKRKEKDRRRDNEFLYEETMDEGYDYNFDWTGFRSKSKDAFAACGYFVA